jgi:hypothetical protein
MAWGRSGGLNAGGGVKSSEIIQRNREKLLADFRANPPAEPPARPPRTQKEGKTHCVHGHELTPENTYLPKSKVRACRICRRKHGDTANKRRKAAKAAGAFPHNYKLTWSVLVDGWLPTREVRAYLTAEHAWRLYKVIRGSSATGLEIWRGKAPVDPGLCEKGAIHQAAERVYRVERAKMLEEVREADAAYIEGKRAAPWGMDLESGHPYAAALRAYIHTGFSWGLGALPHPRSIHRLPALLSNPLHLGIHAIE